MRESKPDLWALDAMMDREREIATIDSWLRRTDGAARTLVLQGDRGIGKSLLWQRSLRRARDLGYRVLTARPSEVESGLGFCVLGDLLADVDQATVDDLPPPQRHAVMAALLRTEPPAGIELRGVALGLLSILRLLMREEPVLLAIDDAHCVDEPSGRALTFAIRRLDGEPALLLAALRPESSAFDRLLSTLDDERRVLCLAPLSEEALAGLLRSRLAGPLRWPATAGVHRLSGGNPALALEIGRALGRGQVESWPHEPPRPPDELRLSARARVAGLAAATMAALLLVAAAPRLTVSELRRLLGDDADVSLAEAERWGLLELHEGEVRARDVAVLATVYWDADDARRRQAHARLAEHAPDALDRVRHLALASDGPAPALASELERAAASAAERGVFATAGSLGELCLRKTPGERREDRARRRMLTIEVRARTGDAAAVGELLQAAGSTSLPEAERLRLLRTGARARLLDAGSHAAAEVMDGSAGGLALIRLFSGELDSFASVRELEVSLEAGADWPGRAFLQAQFSLWGDDLAGARSRLWQLERQARETGDVMVRPLLLARLAEVDCWLGRWLEATALGRRGYHLAAATGQRALHAYHHYVLSLGTVHLGDLEGAREAALRGEEVALLAGFQPAAVLNRSVLGHLELSRGHPAAALHDLMPVTARGWSLGAEPGLARFLPDAIEALIAQRELAAAARLIAHLEELGPQLGARWPLAAAARGHAALESAEGRHADAQRWSWRASADDRELDRGLELGRDLLTQSAVLRRCGNRSGARAALEHALAIFTKLGTAAWRERAEAELSRAGGPRADPMRLDPRERQVAELSAQGLSEADVARRLALDVRNVHLHLRSIYRKLGVRSRSGLAQRMGAPPP